MANNKQKNSWAKRLLNSVKGAGSTISNYYAARQGNKQVKKNIDTLAGMQARKTYRKQTGVDMTPSMRRDAADGFGSKMSRDYENLRKQIKKKKMRDYNYS